MELSSALTENLYGFVAALIGAIVGGLFTLKATDKAIREENQKEARLDEKEVQNLLDALGVEIRTLWGFHMRRIGALIEGMGDTPQALEFYYPLTQDYFTVYNTNAMMIGRVKEPVLREAVVVCYNKCKKVVDGFKYNNVLFRDHRDMVNMSDGSPQFQQRIDAKYKELLEYAQVIKEDHYELKGYIEHMLTLLKNRDMGSDV